MDKELILAVAGSGKTTYIINHLKLDRRYLVLTYTIKNYENIKTKIINANDGRWPDNILLMTYFSFLYQFCYKPFLADRIKARGYCFDNNVNKYLKQSQLSYYLSPNNELYSNRISLLFEKTDIVKLIVERIEEFFDELIIDEVQDIGGRDFSFLEKIMTANIDMLFVGDFHQHTYSTSFDGNVNKALFDSKNKYIKRFTNKGFSFDETTLINSWRCSKEVCDYISTYLGIRICSNRSDHTSIVFVDDNDTIQVLLNDSNIIKLHFMNSNKYGDDHLNWGETKGEDCYEDVCVLLNKNTMKHYIDGKLNELPPLTKNKLYVAITRAHGNVYFVDESMCIN